MVVRLRPPLRPNAQHGAHRGVWSDVRRRLLQLAALRSVETVLHDRPLRVQVRGMGQREAAAAGRSHLALPAQVCGVRHRAIWQDAPDWTGPASRLQAAARLRPTRLRPSTRRESAPPGVQLQRLHRGRNTYRPLRYMFRNTLESPTLPPTISNSRFLVP